MTFNSLPFLYAFLPIFLISYYLFPARAKNALLFLGSLVFYAAGSCNYPVQFLLILLLMALNWACGLLGGRRGGKFFLVFGILADVLVLCTCKYLSFLLSAFADIKLTLAAPIGISFFVFSAIAYLADVMSGKQRPERNFIDFGAALLMFAKITSGPIVRYPDMYPALKQPEKRKPAFAAGLRMFVLGLGAKVILANRLAGLWGQIQLFGSGISTWEAWIGIAAYSLELYFDFAGYSLMAIGLGKMLGFGFARNFDLPYISVSMTEFWRRWHISLGSWFRDYVYIPLGGNRKGMVRTILNLFVVWLLTGIWHGAGLNFILWGMFLFVIMAIERFGLKKFMDSHRVLGHIYMTLLIPTSWAFFVLTDTAELFRYLGRMFAVGGFGTLPATLLANWVRTYGIYFGGSLICMTGLPRKLMESKKLWLVRDLALVGILLWSMYFISLGADDPALYFQF